MDIDLSTIVHTETDPIQELIESKEKIKELQDKVKELQDQVYDLHTELKLTPYLLKDKNQSYDNGIWMWTVRDAVMISPITKVEIPIQYEFTFKWDTRGTDLTVVSDSGVDTGIGYKVLPHTNTNGGMCIGGLSNEMAEAMDNYDIDMIKHLLTIFYKFPTKGDLWGMKYTFWMENPECTECGNKLSEDDIDKSKDNGTSATCEDCREYNICEVCGTECSDEIYETEIWDNSQDGYVYKQTGNECDGISYCELCDSYYIKNYNDDIICSKCMNSSECRQCGDKAYEGLSYKSVLIEKKYYDNTGLCSYCRDMQYICEDCNSEFFTEDNCSYNNRYLCEDCMEKAIKLDEEKDNEEGEEDES